MAAIKEYNYNTLQSQNNVGFIGNAVNACIKNLPVNGSVLDCMAVIASFTKLKEVSAITGFNMSSQGLVMKLL